MNWIKLCFVCACIGLSYGSEHDHRIGKHDGGETMQPSQPRPVTLSDLQVAFGNSIGLNFGRDEMTASKQSHKTPAEYWDDAKHLYEGATEDIKTAWKKHAKEMYSMIRDMAAQQKTITDRQAANGGEIKRGNQKMLDQYSAIVERMDRWYFQPGNPFGLNNPSTQSEEDSEKDNSARSR